MRELAWLFANKKQALSGDAVFLIAQRVLCRDGSLGQLVVSAPSTTYFGPLSIYVHDRLEPAFGGSSPF